MPDEDPLLPPLLLPEEPPLPPPLEPPELPPLDEPPEPLLLDVPPEPPPLELLELLPPPSDGLPESGSRRVEFAPEQARSDVRDATERTTAVRIAHAG